MLQPSSLPLGVRSVEWLRSHHFNWLVDEVERVYYSWNAPSKGGPPLKTLPSVGLQSKIARHRSRPATRGHAPWPPPVIPVFPHPLPAEGEVAVARVAVARN